MLKTLLKYGNILFLILIFSGAATAVSAYCYEEPCRESCCCGCMGPVESDEMDMAGCGCEMEIAEAQCFLPIVFIEEPYVPAQNSSIDLDYPHVEDEADFTDIKAYFDIYKYHDRPPPEREIFLLHSSFLI